MHYLKFNNPLQICIVFTILISSHKPTLSIDPRYKACEPKSCGNGPTIRYPFWLSQIQEPFCGFPSFKLTCDGENTILRISNDDYVIKQIFYSNHSLIASNTDLYDEQCPVPKCNISLDETPFGFTSHRVNLSFFYSCTAIPSTYELPYRIDCLSNQTHRSFATFHEAAALEHTNYSLSSCGSLVSVPADTASEVDFDTLLRMNYVEILKMGFGLSWPAAYSCSGCQTSGGRCGFVNNEFACFCGNQSHKTTCDDGTNWRTKTAIGVACGVGGLAIMGAAIYCYQWRKKKRGSMLLSRNISGDISSGKDLEKEGGGSSTYGPGVREFSYEELVDATNNFDPSKELGDGGFGTVYKGNLKDGRVVAVKRLYENNYKRVEQFINEVEILASVRHHNLVSLYGCTSRHCRELLLVYEYVPNGTIADHLHGSRARPGGLPWPTRLSIALDTAGALAYLHHSDVIHRDVKSNNILLDSHFRVKVADFGLSRLFPTHATHVSTAPQGTPGYVDPEYHQCYQLTSKSDVFSFGVVLVELLSSLPAVDITRHRHDINLSTMALSRIQNHALHELVDKSFGFTEDHRVRQSVTAVAELAFRCLQQEKDMRPSMDDVWEELKSIKNIDDTYGKAEKTVVIVASADEAVLLKNGSLTLSPDSVTLNWGSSTTTPNTSK